MRKPEKIYKNLQDCVEDMSRLVSSNKVFGIAKYPCFKCSGRGWDYDINDHDPVEGYKMAEHIKCNYCNGTGIVSKKDFVESYYKPRVEKYKKELQEYKQFKKLVKIALKKLTKKDIKVLIEYLNDGE